MAAGHLVNIFLGRGAKILKGNNTHAYATPTDPKKLKYSETRLVLITATPGTACFALPGNA